MRGQLASHALVRPGYATGVGSARTVLDQVHSLAKIDELTREPRRYADAVREDLAALPNVPGEPGDPLPLGAALPILEGRDHELATALAHIDASMTRVMRVRLDHALAADTSADAALPVPTSFNLYTVKPWPRNALVAVDGKLLFTLVNRYYGGSRPTPKAARETLTPTEQRLNKIVIEMLVDLCFDECAVGFSHGLCLSRSSTGNPSTRGQRGPRRFRPEIRRDDD